jgi:hypothetical protein
MSTTNMLNGAQVIVDYLIQQKAPYAFGLCGHGNIQFIDALYERKHDIKTISVHHESVAGFMADVYYRVSGQPIATFTSCGPGSANLTISLGNAFLNSVPFMAVTGNVPTSQFNRGAFQELYRHYQADFPPTERDLPTFRDAHGKRRCIVPVDGFFEWKAIKGQKAKQPFAIAGTGRHRVPASGFAHSPSSPPTPTTWSPTSMTACRSFLRRTTTRAGWERSRTRVTSCGLPRRADAHVADFDPRQQTGE